MKKQIMKCFIFGILFAASASVLHAQTMRITPDSSKSGTGIPVTIVGIGTKFESTENVSELQVFLEQSGNEIGFGFPCNLVNDSTITTTIGAGSGTVGWCDLVVKVTDTSLHVFTQDSAFYSVAPPPVPPSITGVYPADVYDSETVAISIYSQATNFDTGSLPTILFQKNGITYFTGQTDSLINTTTLAATVTVARSIPAGTYDVIVTNSIYSDTGKALYTVLGPTPKTYYAPMTIAPDSGYPGQELSVTIVGTGTNFTPTNNVSGMGVTVLLEHLGFQYAQSSSVSVVNATTLHASMQVGSDMLVGQRYDLVVEVNDTTDLTYIQDSAFYVTQPPPSIVSVYPSSLFSAQKDTLMIQGLYTDFENGPSPTVAFQLNGATVFTAQSLNVISNFTISAIVTVPSSAPTGTYNVVAYNADFSDTGVGKFTVLGPEPVVTLIPDSGAGSTMFNVTIVGQNTDFAPTTGVSLPLTMTINLNQAGVSFFETTADTVFSNVLADALFSLPDSLPQGIYDVEISGNTYSGSSYDLHTPFLVTPSITIGIHSPPVANAGDTVTIDLTGSGVNFIYNGTQFVKTVRLVNGTSGVSLTAQSVTVTDDTTLSAVFAIPDTSYVPGNYVVEIVEPGTNRTLIGSNMFKIFAPAGVTETTSFPDIINDIHVFPNPASDVTSISFTMAAPSPVQLLIYDALGRTVATLCDRELGTGMQKFEWASDDAPDGSYFYEIIAGDDRYGGRIVVQH
jgi:hypothetical protein